MGDGTGCDNMTAVIVKFEQKLQELTSTINPAETENAILEAAKEKKQSIDANAEQSALKRSASPDAGADEASRAEITSKSKRLKIEGDLLEPEDANAKNATDAISCPPSSVGEQKETAVVVSST